MGRSLESSPLQTIASPKVSKPEPFVAEVTRASPDTFEIADKFHILHLEDHDQATKRTPPLKGDDGGERQPKIRRSRWSIRGRRRRVRLQLSPVLGYLRGVLQSCTDTARSASTAAVYHMGPRLPVRKQLGLLLAKLHFSRKRARRIHSIQSSFKSDEQAQPLLLSSP